MKNLNKKDLEKLIKLYEEEREHFTWLITFEEFVSDYVVKCEHCGEYFVTDMGATMCEECLEYFEEENKNIENDPDWAYFEEIKTILYMVCRKGVMR